MLGVHGETNSSVWKQCGSVLTNTTSPVFNDGLHVASHDPTFSNSPSANRITTPSLTESVDLSGTVPQRSDQGKDFVDTHVNFPWH
jgi:hypothetical protein